MPKQIRQKSREEDGLPPRTMEITVKGLNFYATPTTLQRMAKSTPMKIRLERDKANPTDPNAVKVFIMEEPWIDFHIGYVARQTASVIAPRMDAGRFRVAEAWMMFLHPEKSEGGAIVKVGSGRKD